MTLITDHIGDRMKENPSSAQTRTEEDAHRELFVINDFRSMPAKEMRPMFDTFGRWLAAWWQYKIRGKSDHPEFVLEMRRLTRAKHVPKRIQKNFDPYLEKLKRSGFVHSFDATVGALGPYSCGLLGMTDEETYVHFVAFHAVTQIEGRIADDSFFRFLSWLDDETLIETISRGQHPSPRRGIDRLEFAADDPITMLRRHRERLRKKSVQKINPSDLWARIEAEHQSQVDDFIARGVIRAATPAEVTRIRRSL